MGYLLLNILLAAVPAVLILLFIYRRDRKEKESPLLVFFAFVVGFFAVIPAIVIEILISDIGFHMRGPAYLLFRAFAVAALVEESMKLTAVRLFLFKQRHLKEIADGVLYTIAASLGFAFFENILYSFGSPLVMITRGITAVPMHAAASGILGYYVGVTRATGKKRLAVGLVWAILIHGLYDFLLFTGSWAAIFVIPLLVASVFLLLRLYKKARQLDRADADT